MCVAAVARTRSSPPRHTVGTDHNKKPLRNGKGRAKSKRKSVGKSKGTNKKRSEQQRATQSDSDDDYHEGDVAGALQNNITVV